MFSPQIVGSDAFLDMPLTAQALYFHLNMEADHDGFVNPRRIMRMIGAANDDLQILIAKRFLIGFDSGVVVIKHWWINNLRRLDRHVPTTYQDELKELGVKDNKAYTKNTTQLGLLTDDASTMTTKRQPNGNRLAPETNRSEVTRLETNRPELKRKEPNQQQGFKKTFSDPKMRKSYAKAVRLDEELAKKEQGATDRKPDGKGLQSAREIAEKIKLRAKGATA